MQFGCISRPDLRYSMVPGVAMKGVKLLRGESLDCLHMLYMLPTTSLELQGGY